MNIEEIKALLSRLDLYLVFIIDEADNYYTNSLKDYV